jgi:hypothetical protein
MGKVIDITADLLLRRIAEQRRAFGAGLVDEEGGHGGKTAKCANAAGFVGNGCPGSNRAGNKGHAAEQNGGGDSGHATGPLRLLVGDGRD